MEYRIFEIKGKRIYEKKIESKVVYMKDVNI